MIIWLASYPQSGSNFVRSLLSSYIFSQDGSFHSELIENIVDDEFIEPLIEDHIENPNPK